MHPPDRSQISDSHGRRSGFRGFFSLPIFSLASILFRERINDIRPADGSQQNTDGIYIHMLRD